MTSRASVSSNQEPMHNSLIIHNKNETSKFFPLWSGTEGEDLYLGIIEHINNSIIRDKKEITKFFPLLRGTEGEDPYLYPINHPT